MTNYIFSALKAGALLLVSTQANAWTQSDLECMTTNVYHEARGESDRGQLMVMDVVLNRVDHKNFDNTVCGVVYAHAQFSWTLDIPIITRWDKWNKIKILAEQSLNGDHRGITQGSTFYHAEYVTPYWAKHFELVEQEGLHIFYRY
jgi:spore germination cell wall hydrolase CwlJ-like protein